MFICPSISLLSFYLSHLSRLDTSFSICDTSIPGVLVNIDENIYIFILPYYKSSMFVAYIASTSTHRISHVYRVYYDVMSNIMYIYKHLDKC